MCVYMCECVGGCGYLTLLYLKYLICGICVGWSEHWYHILYTLFNDWYGLYVSHMSMQENISGPLNISRKNQCEYIIELLSPIQ